MPALKSSADLGFRFKIGTQAFSADEMKRFRLLVLAKQHAAEARGIIPEAFYAQPPLQTVASAARYVGFER